MIVQRATKTRPTVIACDQCEVQATGSSATVLRTDLRRQGWASGGSPIDWCPTCWKSISRRAANQLTNVLSGTPERKHLLSVSDRTEKV